MKKGHDLNKIINNFQISGLNDVAVPFGSGYIHDTYLFNIVNRPEEKYILQKINNSVFLDVEGLMNNIRIVTNHIQNKQKLFPERYPHLKTLEIIPSKEGTYFYKDPSGNYWRAFNFIPDSISFDHISSNEQAFQEGKAFGQFLALLHDLHPENLIETIPDFHNIEKRLITFGEVKEKDRVNRVKNSSEEIEFIYSRAEEMKLLLKLHHQGKLPERITHNDTKLNNVLFDKTGKAICVIDLDTVMPGFVAYDFGDAIRTTINKAKEDEADLSKIEVDMQLFRSFTKGFLKETKHFLLKEEVSTLAFGAKLLTFIMGLRFFTDYINGDTYYKINFPEHNLQRARAQFQLLRKMEENFEEMNRIVEQEGKKLSSI